MQLFNYGNEINNYNTNRKIHQNKRIHYEYENRKDSDSDTPENELLDDVSSSEEELLKSSSLGIRDYLWLLFTNPTYSYYSGLYALINITAVFISTLSFIITTLPIYHDTQPEMFSWIEIITIIIFTFDYFIKMILTRRHRIKWALQLMNVIDLLAVMPYFIETIWDAIYSQPTLIAALVVLRILRLFRVFRAFKLAKYSTQVPVVLRSIQRSGGGFAMALFSLLLAVTIFASLVYFAEIGGCVWNDANGLWVSAVDGSISPFQSIPHSIWWAVVTMTTVGYGDMHPSTPLGKLAAGTAMICSIFILVFPLTMLAGNFKMEYQKTRLEEELKQLRASQRKLRNGQPQRFHNPYQRCKWMYSQCYKFRNTIEETRMNINTFEKSFVRLEYYIHRLRRHYKRCEEEERAEGKSVRYQFF